MGCTRDGLIEKPNVTVGTEVIEICTVPAAREGQMSFFNRGATDIAIRLGQNHGSKEVTLSYFTIFLPAGKAFSEEGLVLGSVIARSSAAAGLLDTYISYWTGP